MVVCRRDIGLRRINPDLNEVCGKVVYPEDCLIFYNPKSLDSGLLSIFLQVHVLLHGVIMQFLLIRNNHSLIA